MDRIFKIFERLFTIHVETKTIDETFHKATERWYELAFKAFHKVQERRQDLKLDNPVDNLHEVQLESYDLLEELKKIIEEEIDSKQTKWYDNLLRSLVDDIENECGNSRWFVREELKIKEMLEAPEWDEEEKETD